MEVVVLCVAESNESANNVDKGCIHMSAIKHHITNSHQDKHTHGRGVLAKVPVLVASEKTFGLHLGGRSPRELLVEAHHFLHANSIWRGSDGLRYPLAPCSTQSQMLHRCVRGRTFVPKPFAVVRGSAEIGRRCVGAIVRIPAEHLRSEKRPVEHS